MNGAGEKREVLIAGAGVGGLEAALALRDFAGERVDVELHDPRREFAFRPFSVGGPYGGGARAFRYSLGALCVRCGARFRPGGIVSVDPSRRMAVTRNGDRVAFDYLIVASGARVLWSVPGAITFWGAADEGQVGEAIAAVRAGEVERLVVTMAEGPSWVLPMYELALLASVEAERAGAPGTRIAIVTPEQRPLEKFGRRVVEGVSELLEERGIEVVAGSRPVRFQDRRLRTASGREIEADVAIGLPRCEGRRVGGVPQDEGGFVAVDAHCRVRGLEDVYAVGDVTAFPVKQGTVACEQADAVGEAIGAAVGAGVEARPCDPILRGALWTGSEPRYLYGRPSDDGDGVSGFGAQPEGPMAGGRVRARYLTPLVDRLSAESDHPGAGAGSAVVAHMPPRS